MYKNNKKKNNSFNPRTDKQGNLVKSSLLESQEFFKKSKTLTLIVVDEERKI